MAHGEVEALGLLSTMCAMRWIDYLIVPGGSRILTRGREGTTHNRAATWPLCAADVNS